MSQDARLNGKPFQPLTTGVWTAAEWDALLTEWRSIAGPTGVLSLRVTGMGSGVENGQNDVVRLSLSDEPPGRCYPSLTRSFDGKSVAWATCSLDPRLDPSDDSEEVRPAFSLDEVTGEDLAFLTAGICTDTNGKCSPDVSYRLTSDFFGGLELTVVQDGVLTVAVARRPGLPNE